ncbi:type 2 isopentenyl-diphosphate Delta-isomerase [Gardnerella sp. KA00255]
MDFDDICLPHNSDPVTAEAFAERNAKLCDSNGSSESSASIASSENSGNSENSENELSSNNFSSSASSNNISSNNKVKKPYNTLENAIKDLESQITSSRKNMHLTLADKQYKPHSEAGFDDISFMPNSLPDLSLENIDTSVNPLGCSWSMPLYINAMTGGSKESKAVNAALARVAAKTNMPMASGSLSAALRDSSLIDTFSVIRKENPKGFVLANVSAGTSADNAMRAVEMINANALQVHLNVAQELVMPEGDRDFSNWMSSIEEISIACQKANIPMIVKETGCGMTAFDAHRLYDLGVRAIDVGGRGGTNFVTIENARRDGNEYDYLASWGLTTVESLIEVMREPNCANKNMTVFASGGVRTPLDVVRAIALGAQAVGVAGEFLHTLMHSGEEVLVQQICDWTEQIRRIMALLGVEKVQDIQSKSRFVLTGKSAQFKANSFNLD